MKRTYLMILISGLCLFAFSCKDDFELEAQFKPRNVLSCIIRPDTALQVVTLSTSYQGDGMNPYAHTESPSIVGADVKMWYNNNVYEFKDTSFARIDTSRYKTPVTVYYNDQFKPNQGGGIVEIEALLSNGLLLSSYAEIPDVSGISFALSDTLVPPPYSGKHVEFNWTNIGELIYDPKFVIVYYNRVDHQRYEKEIPISYTESNGVYTPVYPIASINNSVVYDMDAVDRAMEEIAGDDPVKSNYSVTKMIFNVMIFDQNLSAYYSSVQQFLDGFTVKLDQADFTNISGGFGIFGSYNIIQYGIKVTEEYVDSFGYIVGFGN